MGESVKRFGIIAIGYNRPACMDRLLQALSKAEYKGDEVTLIISLDNSGKDDVLQVAESFQWPFGSKEIKTYPERQGLRRHILTCGTYMEAYQLDAVAVFEDDVYPSLGFYNYMKQAVDFFEGDDDIAGISLYNHQWNANNQMPFQSALSGYDNYFSAYAQSWGQIWMRKQWKDFMDWYEGNKEKPFSDKVPKTVAKWPATSWLKYHIAYCIEMKKYFVYPYESLSTCFAEQGEHTIDHIGLFQVPIARGADRQYQFCPLQKSTVIYDAFFERENIGKYLNIKDEDLCVDLYGAHESYRGFRYLLTMKAMPNKVIRSFALELRPHEENVIYGISGEKIFLYDLNESDNTVIEDATRIEGISYYFRLNRSGTWLIKYAIDQKIALWRKKRRKD